MADSEYPDDIQFAGLVQAATAAADEQTRTSSGLGKRKRVDETDNSAIDPSITNDGTSVSLQNSAAVLFREPSVKSKKYSRPPLGKVYTSLELAPELFLKLQGVAKKFMLDPAHPERRDVVGHRQQGGGTDVAKLKLWTCVEEFLRDEGNGDRFFGPNAGEGVPGGPNERTMFWPEDSQKIIRACMPVMRKMVTNERQRLYAAQSRKPRDSLDANEQGQFPTAEQLDESSLMDVGTPQGNSSEVAVPEPEDSQRSIPEVPNPTMLPAGSVALHVNLMSSDGNNLRRLIPRFSLSPEEATNLSALRAEIKKRVDGTSTADIYRAPVKVWMSDGLVQVKNDGEWMVALLSAGTVEWMDGEVRVLVEV